MIMSIVEHQSANMSVDSWVELKSVFLFGPVHTGLYRYRAILAPGFSTQP